MQPLCFVHTLVGEPFMLLNINLSPAKTKVGRACREPYICMHSIPLVHTSLEQLLILLLLVLTLLLMVIIKHVTGLKKYRRPSVIRRYSGSSNLATVHKVKSPPLHTYSQSTHIHTQTHRHTCNQTHTIISY